MTGPGTVCTYIRIIVGALLFAASVGPVWAQSSEQIRNWCFEDATDDKTIQGCTAVIKTNRETPQDLANAYFNRGSAYAGKFQYERAIQDYDQVIKLKPDSFAAFESRCAARMALKQLEAALADCNEALRLQPGSALQSRGLVNLKFERFDVAIGDFNEALKLEPKNAVALFGRGVARRKRGDVAGGDADIAAARAANGGVADRLAAIGITTK